MMTTLDILKQAKAAGSELAKLSSEDKNNALLAMADALVCRVPAYILRCDMSENSVLCAYQAVKGEKENEHTAGL